MQLNLKRWLLALLLGVTLYLCARFFADVAGGSPQQVWTLIATIGWPLWLLLALLVTAFYLLDWIRFRSALGVLGQRLGPVSGMRLTCVSYFVSSLTPSADLHTPAMVYLLTKRDGVPAPQALAASLSKSIYMTLWICLVSWTALAAEPDIALPAELRESLPWLSLPLLGIALMLALIAFFPLPVCNWAQARAANQAPASLSSKLLLGLADSASCISRIGRSTDAQHLLCHLASLAFIGVYIAIGWLLALHFGFELTPLQAITVFSSSLMIAYLSPVPGSIGITEVATSYMLDPNLDMPGMAVALTLRILCWYLVALPGGVVLAWSFRQDGRWSLQP